jgi:plastocyanin
MLALVGAVAVRIQRPPAAVQAADRWDVQVAADLENPTMVINSFMPSTLTVHEGDTVAFTWASTVPHTVSFLAGTAAPALVVPGPGSGELMLAGAFFPIPLGPPTASVIVDGSGPVSSGVPDAGDEPARFAATFPRAGIYAYACLIHPGMNGSVEVLPVAAPLVETPAQASARGQAQAQAQVAALRADAMGERSASARIAGETSAHTVAAGISLLAGPGNAGGARALAFLPGNLSVRRGDWVVWTVADPLELHTITFVSGGAAPPFIEPRGETGGPGGAPLVVIAANVAGPSGGQSYSGQGYVNSGILGNGNSFLLRIDAPPGTYDYFCVIHGSPTGGMKASVTVTQ